MSTFEERREALLSLPVTFRVGGRRFADLDELLSPSIATVALAELTPQLWSRLTARRIARQRTYAIYRLGNGRTGKTRAMREVRLGSALGLQLTAIEKSHVEEFVRRETDARNS